MVFDLSNDPIGASQGLHLHLDPYLSAHIAPSGLGSPPCLLTVGDK